ncbi:MAG TPA: S9 family peptidase [Usitatibacter sp.]|nr:S9 family peptidase [Usitatibacter sp.]
MKRFLAFLAFACNLLALDALAADAPTPVEDFFRLPRYAAMEFAPDGQHIAALSPVSGRQNLVVLDGVLKDAHAVTAFDGKDVVWFQWLNSKRLMFATGSLATRDSDARGGALWAVDLDGALPLKLSDGSADEEMGSALRFVGHGLEVVRFLPGEGDDFIAQEITYDSRGRDTGALVRIDSRSGRRTNIGLGKPDKAEEESWVVDDRGVARAMRATGKGRTRIYYRAGPDAPWQKLDDFATTQPGWLPLAMGEDDRTLYVSAYRGEDKAAIYRYDPAKRDFGEAIARHPQVDLTRLVRNEGKVVGVSFDADRHGTAMFDPQLARIQKAVDSAFPDTVNLLSWTRDRSRVLVTSYSDVSPGSFYLFDVARGRMAFLGDRAPWIHPASMSPMKPVRYTARDGLEIPAYLTLPRGGETKNLPLVMVVHGGPWVEGDQWGFDPEAQFLASRGYAVLQPNFRGTLRYGWKHMHSSFGQWGLAMEDDVADGVKWAVAQGIADPRRVCIYGASYGGYATMMGLAKTPELYRCGINYVGVTDIPLFLTMTWADYAHSDFIDYDAKVMVGDPDRDAKRLAETSPVNLAARIKAPVLMAYGAADVRVPIEHGTRMKDALDKAGAKYDWIVMDGEGHGFRDPQNQKAFYTAMEKFLARNLRPE